MTRNLFTTRREMLQKTAGGFGNVALTALLGESAVFASQHKTHRSPRTIRSPHFEPQAKNVIFLFMDGGVSHLATFDPKPRLTQDHGKPFGSRIEPTQFDNIGQTLASPLEVSTIWSERYSC